VHLVSSGLDLLPTICDYAGVDGKSDPCGKSLRPLFEGRSTDWRKTLGVESEIGRMVVGDDGCKYIRYDALGIEERLHDLNVDPGEMTHFETNPAYKTKLAQLKEAFEKQWFPGF
jgi:choline-sulfatase